MSEVIAREVAETEVQGWCDRFEVTLPPADRERIVRSVMDGRLSLDEGKEEFVYKLRRPLILNNSSTIDALRIHEPTTGQVRDANKAGKGDEFEVSLRLLACVVEQPLGVIDRIGQKDLTSLGVLFGFFG